MDNYFENNRQRIQKYGMILGFVLAGIAANLYVLNELPDAFVVKIAGLVVLLALDARGLLWLYQVTLKKISIRVTDEQITITDGSRTTSFPWSDVARIVIAPGLFNYALIFYGDTAKYTGEGGFIAGLDDLDSFDKHALLDLLRQRWGHSIEVELVPGVPAAK